MSDEKVSTSKRIPAPEVTMHAVSTGVGLVGGLMALYPHLQMPGIALSAAAGTLGTAAGRVHAFLSEAKAKRVEEFVDEVRRGLDEACIAGGAERVEDLIVESVGFAADAETEEKRRMMGRVVVEAARQEKAEATKVEALLALRCIKQLTPEGAALFALLSAHAEVSGGQAGSSEALPIRAKDGYRGLAPVPVRDGLQQLIEADLVHHPRTKLDGSMAPAEVLVYIAKLQITGRMHTVTFTERGNWLRSWTQRNTEGP